MIVKVRVGPGGQLLGRGGRTVDRQEDNDQNNLNIRLSNSNNVIYE